MPQQYTPRVALICPACGKAFARPPSRIWKQGPSACSRACRFAYASRPRDEAEVLSDGTARFPLRAQNGSIKAYTVIDPADAQWVGQWRWYVDGGYAKRYAMVAGRKRHVMLHREILGLVFGDGLEGDHRNRDRLDNRRENLRVVPKGANPQNKSKIKTKTSAFRGVSWDKSRGYWSAQIMVKRKRIQLGRFADEREAAEAALAARKRLMPYAVD